MKTKTTDTADLLRISFARNGKRLIITAEYKTEAAAKDAAVLVGDGLDEGRLILQRGAQW